jgi:prepilin-type N-terminal cleavage/methylation domain-containing protein/prepilin-type processing-associated H-X9-DG protein
MKVSLTNRWHRRSRSRGFTLVELLVVIAIIAALAALIFPAVQAARATSKRAASQSNLRNIALAILNYEAQTGAFPIAGRVPGDTKPRVGWITQVLPQLERKDLYSRYDFNKDWFAAENIAVTATQIPVLIDSASPQPDRYDDRPESASFASGTLNVTGPSVLVGITDYANVRSVDVRLFTGSGAGSTGTAGIDGVNPGGSGIGPAGGLATGGTYASTKTLGAFVNATGNGIMPPNIRARLADVTDGLSHTILLAESHARPYLYRRGKKIENNLNVQRVNGGGWSRNANDIRLQGYNKDGTQEIGPYGINAANGTPVTPPTGNLTTHYGTDGTGAIYSFHAGGAHVAFGDGSVKFLSEKVDIAVLAALVTRDQNELVDDGELSK